MAPLSSPPPPPLLDVGTLPTATSPLPELTPSPVATFPSPSPPASVTPSCAASGRGKSLGWSQETPPSGKSGGGPSPPSFKEVLLGAIAAAAPPSVGSPRASAPVSPVVTSSPRIVLRKGTTRREPPLVGPDAEGWVPAVSRHTRKELHRRGRLPRRPVPADLRGRCFNCFSPRHRAVSCRSSPRCFRCRATGHRSYDCVARPPPSTSGPHPGRVWQPVARPLAASPASPCGDHVSAGGGFFGSIFGCVRFGLTSLAGPQTSWEPRWLSSASFPPRRRSSFLVHPV